MAGPRAGARTHVCILMGTYDGARWLPAQLASIAAQTHADWSLILRDDGSQDDTADVVADFARRHPGRDILFLRGPGGQGSAANFLALLAEACVPQGCALAFADQDDAWLPGKIARALAEIARAQDDAQSGAGPRPAVYASRTILTDAALQPDRISTLHRRPPAFGNALVQNVLAGNTIVLDPAAATLMRATTDAALGADVPFHDWWIYQVMTGAGGIVINDTEPGLYYRQHGANVLGAHRGMAGGLARLGMIRDSRYAGWLDRNLAALARVAGHLTPAHRQMAADFAALRRAPGGIARMAGLARLGIHRQTRAGDLMLRLLALTGRL